VRAARNIAIILLLAAAVYALPGGGTAALLVYALLSVAFAGALGFFCVRFYLEHRVDIYGLPDRERGLLYGALAVIVLTTCAAPRLFATAPGVAVGAAIYGGSIFSLVHVYRTWREY
jgi:hypothetical protein